MSLSKNEYSWSRQNNQQFLERVDKKIFDEEYSSNMDEDDKKDFQSKFDDYKLNEELRFNEAIWSSHTNFLFSWSKPIKTSKNNAQTS